MCYLRVPQVANPVGSMEVSTQVSQAPYAGVGQVGLLSRALWGNLPPGSFKLWAESSFSHLRPILAGCQAGPFSASKGHQHPLAGGAVRRVGQKEHI